MGAACGADTSDDPTSAATTDTAVTAGGAGTGGDDTGPADDGAGADGEQPVLSVEAGDAGHGAGDDAGDGAEHGAGAGAGVDPAGDAGDADPDGTGSTADPATDPDGMPTPTDERRFVAALVEAETAIRDTTLTPELTRAWGRRQQALYRALSFRPEWAPVLDTIQDPAIREAAALNWSARQSLSSLVATEKTHDDLPAWRVVEPLPPETLIAHYKEAEARTGVPWEYVAGINLVETRMGRIEGISTAGAVGPMQFLPTTWAECCDGDPTNPADAIIGAATYLTHRGGPEDMRKALWGYNNSDHYVDAVSAYAEVMAADERAYFGYHAWEIYFLTTEGLIRIPIGYEQPEAILAVDWLAEHPDTLFTADNP